MVTIDQQESAEERSREEKEKTEREEKKKAEREEKKRKEKEEREEEERIANEKFAVMKGYKVTADGKVTSYFHTEISEEAKKLIGDVRPQRITSPSPPPEKNTAQSKHMSQWNSASTFESKNFFKWAQEKVKVLFPVEYQLTDEYRVVCKHESLEGLLELAFMRGRPRIINDLSHEFKWEIFKKGEEKSQANGTLKYENDGNAEYDEEYKCDESKGVEAQKIAQAFVRKDNALVRKNLLQAINDMMEDFRVNKVGLEK